MGGNNSSEQSVDSIGAHADPEQLKKAARDHPFSKGHSLLSEFANALEKEYVQNGGPAVGDFLDDLPEQRVTREGVEKKDFDEWTTWVEALVRESYLERRNLATIHDLRVWWGLAATQPPAPPGGAYTPQNLYAPAAQPAYAHAQPAYAQPAQPAYAQPTVSAGPVAVGQPVQAESLYPTMGQPVAQPAASAIPTAAPVQSGTQNPAAMPMAVATPVAQSGAPTIPTASPVQPNGQNPAMAMAVATPVAQ